jgi:hypothetical protein
MIRCRRLRRLTKDTEGSVLLETVIAFPVLLFTVLVLMELSLLYNGKQLANYAAFCAARTAAVNGIDDTVKTHLAAAMAMSSIGPATADDATDVLLAYGLENPDSTVAALCSIPGFQGDDERWRVRLANAYVRTYVSQCDTGTAAGKTRKHVVVNVTYVYHCIFLPLGNVWGQARINSYCDMLAALTYVDPPGYWPAVSDIVELIRNKWRWNITIPGRAVTDYWAG